MAPSNLNNKSVLIMTFIVLLSMCILLMFNLHQLFSNPQNEKYLAFNEVKGMAIEHKGLLFTLNFEQQNSAIENLNLAIPVGKAAISSNNEPLNFTKLIIYRFNKPDLTLTPIQYDNRSLIFSCPEWNPSGYLKDVSYGKLKDLLANTYDL